MKRLLVLNGIAVSLLPFHHAAAYGFSALFLWADRYSAVSVPNYDRLGSAAYYALLLVRQWDAFAIPAFLFVAGVFTAFLARGDSVRLHWQAGLSRIKKLAPPLALWTLFHFVLLTRVPSSLQEVFGVYYFIPLLMQLYLISPWLIRLAKRHWRLLLVVAFVLQFGAEVPRYFRSLGVAFPGGDLIIAATPLWFFPSRSFWFALGLVAGLNMSAFKAWVTRHRRRLAVLVVLTALSALVEVEVANRLTTRPWVGPTFSGVFRNAYAGLVILFYMSLEGASHPWLDRVWAKVSRGFAELGGRSIGIYLANSPAIYVLASLLYHFSPQVLANQALYQVALVTTGLAVPLLLMDLTRRTPLRRIYPYVFG